jgi:hypothetical protein
MKKILFLAAAFAIAGVAFVKAAEGDDYNWYAPGGKGWEGGELGAITLTDKNGDKAYAVGSGGKSKGLQSLIDSVGPGSLKYAYQAIYEALQAQVMVQNVNDNMKKMLFIDGFNVEVPNGAGGTRKMNFKFKDGKNLEAALKDNGTTPEVGDDSKTEEVKANSTTVTINQKIASAGDKTAYYVWNEIKGWENPDSNSFALNLSDILGDDENAKLYTDSEATALYLPVRYYQDDPVTGVDNRDIGARRHKLKYMKIGYLGSNAPDNTTITTNKDEKGAVVDHKLSLYGWTKKNPEEKTIVDVMSIDRAKTPEGDIPKYELIARHTPYDKGYEDSDLVYLSLGDINNLMWTTNWTESVKDIASEEATKVVNWSTNWVRLADAITDGKDEIEEIRKYTENTLNWTTNWFASTADLEYSVGGVKKYIDGQLDIITNSLVGIQGLLDSGSIPNTSTVKAYVDAALDIQTNVVFNAKMAELNGSIESVKDYVDNTFNWTTNWFEGVRKWQEDETRNFVRDFVQDVTNAYTSFQYVENWNVVSNFVYTYLGALTDWKPGDDTPPVIEPEEDPYSTEYEEEPIDDYILPVKNARMLVAITNAPFSRIDASNTLDFVSVGTNKNLLVQIAGFDDVDIDEEDDKYVPVKVLKNKSALDDKDKYELKWTYYPDSLFAITTNDMEIIEKWVADMYKITSFTNVLQYVITNFDVLATIKTNMFEHVDANTLLDNKSIWTNLVEDTDNVCKIEIKGFKDAPVDTIPIRKEDFITGEATLEWAQTPTPDSNNVGMDYGSAYKLGKSLEAINDDITSLTGPTNVWSVFGFSDASEGQVPVKSKSDLGDFYELKWMDVGYALRFIGTENDPPVVVGGGATTNDVKFLSASDSNVKVSVAREGTGGVKITIGVYYK